MITEHILKHYINVNIDHALKSFPDRVTIQRPDPASFSIDAGGTPTVGAPLFLTYQGSTVIPCRFDNSRSFRPDQLRAQEVVANEHQLHLPNGIAVRPDDKITLLEPIERTTNATFGDGLTGWTGATVGATRQELVLGGARAIFADTTTTLLRQTVGAGLTGELLLIELWAEIVDGAVQLNTPAGNLILNEGENQLYNVQAVHAGIQNDIFLKATAAPAQVVVSRFQVWRYRQGRFFEARKFTSASEWDVTLEVLVTEMEFQHSDD